MVSGTVIAQLIAVGFQLIIRRMYSPEQFGAYAVYTGLISIFFIASSGRYNQTVVLPKKDSEAINLVALSSFFALILSVSLFLIVAFFRIDICFLLNIASEYTFALWFFPFGLLFYSLYDIFNFWLIRKKMFIASGTTKIIRRSSDGTMQSAFGLINLKFGLWYGDLVGQFVNFSTALVFSFRNGFSLGEVKISTMKSLARRYVEFPKYNLLPSLLNSISLMAPVLIINKYYSQEITGYYDLTRLVLAIPLTFIVHALYQGILQRVSEKKNNSQSIKKELVRSFYMLLGASVLMVIVISFFSEFIFGLFGDKWSTSAIYAKILIFSFAVKLLVSPYSALFTALEKIKVGSMWQFANFSIIILLVILRNLEIESFLRTFMYLEVISYAIYGVLIISVLNKYEKSLIN